MDSADRPREAPTPREAPAPIEAVVQGDEYPKWPARYGLGALVAAIGTTILAGGFALFPVVFVAWDEDIASPLAILLIFGAQDAIFILAAIGFASVAQPLKKELFGLRRVSIGKAVRWMIVGAVIYVPAMVVVSMLTEANDPTTDVPNALVWISLGIALVVFAPISEEFLFRGFIYQAFRNRLGIIGAALFSSVLFGAGHFDQGWVAIPLITLFGIAMCTVFQKTKSLYPGMALHAIHNGTIFTIALIST